MSWVLPEAASPTSEQLPGPRARIHQPAQVTPSVAISGVSKELPMERTIGIDVSLEFLDAE
ncbi:MAG: hypothetical protein ACRCZF_07255, partial [Gemmataceae bacterium]